MMHNPIMLDSGAYSAKSSGGEVDFDKYAKYLKSLTSRFPHANFVYVNLDIIGDGQASYDNWVRLLDMGLNPLPVFHLGTSETYLVKYIEKTDYVSLGGGAHLRGQRRTNRLDHLWRTYLLKTDGFPKFKVHGLGFADFRIMRRYPWFSIDTSTWNRHASYGVLLVPRPGLDVPLKVQVSKGWRLPTNMKSYGRKGGGSVRHRLNDGEIKAVKKYVKNMGVKLSDVAKPGVLRRLNIRAYYNFMQTLDWPRRFEGAKTTLF